MKKHTLIYTSDLHGNEVQYRKLVNYALKTSADSIIIGGDIAPKDFPDEDFIGGQRRFLEQRLPELLSPVKKKLPQTRIFLMLGNDDCIANARILEKSQDFLYLHGRRRQLTEDFELVGYAYVPVSPFGIKDWEKFDLSEIDPKLAQYYAQRKRSNYNFHGFKTLTGEWEKFSFTPEREKLDSLQKDLLQELFTKKAERTVYVIHSPPDNTCLDLTLNGEHVGSLAVRQFIEKYQPYLTLHSHIHETVDVSGNFQEKIGKTTSLSSGNHNLGEQLALLIFDLYHLNKVERKVI